MSASILQSSAVMTTGSCTSMSVCRCRATTCSPTIRSGPVGRRTSARASLWPAVVRPRRYPRCRWSRTACLRCHAFAVISQLEVLERRGAPFRVLRAVRARSSRARRGAPRTSSRCPESRAWPCPWAAGSCGHSRTSPSRGRRCFRGCHLGEQNDVHGLASVLVGVRAAARDNGALDRGRELTLVESLRARDAARDDLSRFGDVLLQDVPRSL